MPMPTGGTIILPPTTSGSAIFITECNIDWGGERTLASLLSSDGIFIDAGAHIGYYSLYMAPRVKLVWAFEPDPAILPSLLCNCNRRPNVRVTSKALSSGPGNLPFVVGSYGTSRLASGRESGSIEVEVTTLDSEWRAAGEPAVTAIKIDVEGRDLDVLLGGISLIQKCQPLIFTEMNNRSCLDELWSWLKIQKYQAWAHTRERPGASGVRLDYFASRQKAEERYWTMLFLVPLRLQEEFNVISRKPCE